jgi:ankyrin repeat protein
MKACLVRHLSTIIMRRILGSGCLVVLCGLAGAAAVLPARAADAPTCRELERRFELTKANAVPAQLSLALFPAADGGCVPLARRLIDAGASLEARDRLGTTALVRAARAGHMALIELFLAQGAAIDARNLVGATALYAAAENERQASVAFLLAKGADPNLPGRSGVTQLAAAAFKGNDRIVEALIASRADPDVVDTTGKAAITYAAARGFASIVRRLIGAGVDARRAYGNDLTALMWAAGHEDGVGTRAVLDVIPLLLEAGAPIDAADNRGRTALMIAAELGRGAIVEALLARGADRSIADKNGKRAFELAANESVREKLAAK